MNARRATNRDESSPRERATGPAPVDGAMIGVAAWVGAGGESIAVELAGALSSEVQSIWRWSVVAIGGERRSSAAAWVEQTGAHEARSLRELASSGAGMVAVFGGAFPGADDLRFLLDGDRRVVVVAAEPPSLELVSMLGDRAARLDLAPTFVGGDTFALAEPMLSEFRQEGAPVSLSLRFRCARGESTIESLLFDACLTAVSVSGNVESTIGLRRAPAELAQPGSLVAIARCEDGALVSLDVAEGGGWGRSIEFLGAQGRCTIGDALLERTDATGAVRERHDLGAGSGCVGATIASLRRLATARQASDRSRLYRDAIALADAVRLSARTGNAESPARVLELAARP